MKIIRNTNHRFVLTIKNGTIRNFNVGVRLTGSQDTDLINLQVLATRGGPLGGFMGIGLELSNTTGITVQDCIITINNLATEISASGDDILISGTTITGSNPTPLAGTVSLSGDVTIVGSRLVFVVVAWRGRLAVEDSELIRSSIDAAATPSGEHGTYSAKPTGNTFSYSPCSYHCTSEYTTSIVTILGGSNMEFLNVKIHKNTFDGAATAGVFVQTQASTVTDMEISGNIFSNNGHVIWYYLPPLRDINGSLVNDGLHITVPSGTDITVAENQTSDNADYGIEAAPGTVIDGGGNVSSNDPSGCLGVTCA